MGDKLLNGIKSMYTNSLVRVRVKGGESECFRIDSGVGQGHVCPLGFLCINEWSDERSENGYEEEERE